MNFNFNKDTNDFLKLISKSAQIQKMRVFFVGGFVRDYFLNINTKDIDLIVEGNAIEFCQNLPHSIKIKSVHKDFATVKVEYNNTIFDIASTRSEIYPKSACLPVIQKIAIPIEEDIKRRDFTINSMYCEIKNNAENLEYEIIDLLNSKDDIKNKTLRVLHNKSYIDDPTRILRGVDFKYRFGFDFSFDDKRLIDNYFKNYNSEYLSYDRTLGVFKKILSNKFHKEIFKEIIEKKYYRLIFKNEINPNYSLIDKIFSLFSGFDYNKEDFYILLLKSDTPLKITSTSKKKLFDIFYKMNIADIMYYYYIYQDENILWYLKNKDFSFNITGDDLISSGYKKGKLFSQIFESLFEQKILSPDKFNTKEKEINWVLNNFKK